MKKILFAILSCLVVNIAIADDSLPKINMNASYKNIMNSKVIMGAVRPVLNKFDGEWGINAMHLSDSYYLIDDVFLGSDNDVFKSLVGQPWWTFAGDMGDYWYFHIDVNKFSEDLQSALKGWLRKELTLGLLHDICMKNAWTEADVHTYDHLKERGIDTSDFEKEFKRENKRHKKHNVHADHVCELFINMIVLKHNQLVQESKNLDNSPR